MPFILLWTNLTATKLDADFRSALLTTVANSLQKPVEGTALIVNAGPDCCQLGTANPSEPVVLLNIKAIGHLSAEENIGHTKKITGFLTDRLGVAPDRVLIHFKCLEKHEVGKGGTTIEAKMKGEKK